MIRLAVVIPALFAGAGMSDEFVHDFAHDVIDAGLLRVVPSHGRGAFQEGQTGLDVRLPLAEPETYQVAIETVFQLMGDFDVATEFTLISANRPSKGYGVGVMLRVVKETTPTKRAILARANQPKRGNVFVTSIALQQSARDWKRWERAFPSEAMRGRLRLVRKGSKLQFWVAEADSDQWRMLRESEFGPETLRSAAVLVYTGGAPSPVEASIERWTITADELSHVRVRRWYERIWVVWVTVGLTGLLTVVAVVFHTARRRKTGSGELKGSGTFFGDNVQYRRQEYRPKNEPGPGLGIGVVRRRVRARGNRRDARRAGVSQ